METIIKLIHPNYKGAFHLRGYKSEQDFMDSATKKMFEEFLETGEPRLSFRKEKFYYVPNVPLGYHAFRLIGQNREKIDKKMEDELLDSLGTFEVLNDFQKELYTSFSNLFYIGPLREYPQRIYFVSGEKPAYVGTKGERAVEVLFVTSKTSNKVFQRVNSWVKKLGLGKVSFKQITESLYELYVTHPTIKKGSHNLEVNIAAVGFGASQILPIIVEGFYAPENAIILIEQPEIHLHPKLQAEMGDLLTDIVKSGKRLIIETHSEHLLLRIQRRIAEGLVTTDDVAVYYFEQEKRGTKITKLELDKFGRFPNWPKGFFEEDLMEAYEHSRAIAEKIETEIA